MHSSKCDGSPFLETRAHYWYYDKVERCAKLLIRLVTFFSLILSVHQDKCWGGPERNSGFR